VPLVKLPQTSKSTSITRPLKKEQLFFAETKMKLKYNEQLGKAKEELKRAGWKVVERSGEN